MGGVGLAVDVTDGDGASVGLGGSASSGGAACAGVGEQLVGDLSRMRVMTARSTLDLKSFR